MHTDTERREEGRKKEGRRERESVQKQASAGEGAERETEGWECG